MPDNRKPIPASILIFGAADRIGGPLAAFLAGAAPGIRLRLASSKPGKAEKLRLAHPDAEVVVADYYDLDSLRAAVEGMEGIFVIATAGTDETIAMGNLIEALKGNPGLIQVIRLLGLQPEANNHRIPAHLDRMMLPLQHAIAKKMLDDSFLPVTYLNSGATYMDNFFRFGTDRALQRERKLIWPERLIPWIDPVEVGEVAARLFLSDNHRHIGQFHTLNNNHDILRFHEVAALMSQAWGEPIAYDGSKEAFFAEYAHLGPRTQMLWDFFEYDEQNEVVWARNDFVERMLGRKPRTLSEWLIEHRDALLGTA
ncbi:NmrA family NAD(P)-binding protein [Sphingobium sp.]|uniref:NmrA family NAD(P)-binding protein n=1 Tax=Sphingobium sp. TaxID=1912891 RepID=UPI0028BF1A48|nr:NmrA family NAD(P)-binding protein [Sphingobium sp.]